MISVAGYMVPSLAIGVRRMDGTWEYSYDLEKWFPCDKWPELKELSLSDQEVEILLQDYN